MTPEKELPKSCVCRSMAACRRSPLCFWRFPVSPPNAAASIMLSLKTRTAAAIAPISSPRVTPGISVAMSHCARRCMACVMAATGREILRIIDQPPPTRKCRRHNEKAEDPKLRRSAERCAILDRLICLTNIEFNQRLQRSLEFVEFGAHLAAIERCQRGGMGRSRQRAKLLVQGDVGLPTLRGGICHASFVACPGERHVSSSGFAPPARGH